MDHHNRNTATATLNAYVAAQDKLDTLRFITCGSVDDGKSTLIGRLLYESQLIFEDQVATLKKDSKTRNTQDEEIDFSLLVDGLASEREQGITIDVAYRFFNTDHRKFIVADTPGHEQYTRNMATGASTADLAIILIDARNGILPQTKRHTYICQMMGIQHIVVAVNKMDMVDYEEERFEEIVQAYQEIIKGFSFTSLAFIPVSALRGDNIISPSRNMSWYKGPSLIRYIETVQVHGEEGEKPFRLAVQWVNRPTQDFRGFSGTIAAGTVQKGMEVKILPSGETAHTKEIVCFEQSLPTAHKDQAITLVLDREVDVSRGDLIVAANAPCEVGDQFEVQLIWMRKDPGFVGRSYILKLGPIHVNAHILSLKHKVNINTYETQPATSLELNDIVTAKIKLERDIPFESFSECPELGSFILIDKMTNETCAAGMIQYALRRAQNVHKQKLKIDQRSRQDLNGHKSKLLWFTGLSGSGKSTIANKLEQRLYAQGIRTYILDGDNLRHGLNQDLGFTEADRIENIRRAGEVSKLMLDAGVVVMAAFISPFEAERASVRHLVGHDNFVEIFVDTPLDVAESRDPKGLYKKARQGDIPNFTGINSPYERPTAPDIHIETDKTSLDEAVDMILQKLDLHL